MTYQEACAIADEMEWTKTLSWTKNGSYTITRAETNKKLSGLLKPHKMTPAKWREMVIGIPSGSIPAMADSRETADGSPGVHSTNGGSAFGNSVPVSTLDGDVHG